MLIPLYGFLQGDTLGVLVFAHDDDTVADVAARLVKSASIRVAPPARVRVVYGGRVLDPALTIARAGIAPLDRLDVAPEDAA